MHGQIVTEKYLSLCAYYEKQDKNWTSDYKVMVWGDGDSLDRERVRDILLDEYNYSLLQNYEQRATL